MKVRILGRCWNLRFTPLKINRGECDEPTKRGKELRIDSRLFGEEKLEVVLHELLHAAGWHIDEEFVTKFARDAARTLDRLGCRFDGE